jgi:hypothetical protein
MRGLSTSPSALEQLLGLLAAVAAEVGVEQVDHRPQVPALLDVDLEEVAAVVHRRRGVAEQALLLDDAGSVSPWVTMMRRSAFRNSPGHLLPHGVPEEVAEADLRWSSGGVRKMPHL